MNIFRKIRASLRLREAVRQADEKHWRTLLRYACRWEKRSTYHYG